MKRILETVLPPLLLLTGCASPPAEPPPEPEPLFSPEFYSDAGLLAGILEFLHENYADADAATREKLIVNAIRGMVSGLDRYSGYESPEEFGVNDIQRTGAHTGIGVNCVKEENSPALVTAVAPGSPAAEAGLRPGDRLLRVNGIPVADRPLEECVRRLRGASGTTLTLEYLPDGGGTPVSVELKRREIQHPSVPPEAVRMLADGIGFLRIGSFNARTPEEFDAAFAKLQNEGMTRGLIIDLRGNPGGLVESAVKIAERFLPADETVFTVRYRRPPEPVAVRAGAEAEKTPGLPVALLIDPYTASAAELLTGALQDHKRARVFGMRSFGKGTLLRVLPLPDGGALRYASGHYRTPSGKIIEGCGVTPDVEIPVTAEEALLRAPVPDPARDPQLKAALEFLEKSPVEQ